MQINARHTKMSKIIPKLRVKMIKVKMTEQFGDFMLIRKTVCGFYVGKKNRLWILY